jgi:amino acid transporter
VLYGLNQPTLHQPTSINQTPTRPSQANVHPKTQTPIASVVACGLLSALLALFVPIGQLADLTSLGALFAFCVVCLAVIFRCVCYVG